MITAVSVRLMASGPTASHWFLLKDFKPLSWDVTAVGTVADLYVAATAREAGASVEHAAQLKIAKYSGLEDKCIFQPITVESLGPLNETACQFLKDLGRRISVHSGDEKGGVCVLNDICSHATI